MIPKLNVGAPVTVLHWQSISYGLVAVDADYFLASALGRVDQMRCGGGGGTN
jgi:hypothetical protein